MEKKIKELEKKIASLEAALSPEKKKNQPGAHSRSDLSFKDFNAIINASGVEAYQYLRLIIDSIPHLISARDSAGRFTLANRAFADACGTSVENLIGKTDAGCSIRINGTDVRGSDNPEVITALREKIIPDERISYADGTVHHLQTIIRPLGDDQVLVTSVDITEQKNPENELNPFRQDWENIFQAIGHMVIILNRDFRVLAVNRAVEKATGKAGSEFIGRHCYEIFHSPDQTDPPSGCPLEKLCKSETIETVEMEMEALGGYYLVTCTPVLDEEGRIGKVIHIATDITELKKAGEELQKLASIVRHSNESINLATPDGKMSYLNETGMDMLGLTPDEVTKTHIMQVLPEHMRKKVKDDIVPVLFEKGTWKGDFQWVNQKTGVITDTHSHLFTIKNPKTGGIQYYANMSIDTTESKRNEEERIKLERQVQHAQKLESLGVLAGGIAHDFNNILMTILGNADLALLDISPMSPARESIKEIERAAWRASELARQMLAYSGKGKFVIEAINLTELVKEMIHLLDVSISKKAVMKYNFSDNLPSFNGDVTQIRQIVMNLITNASDAIGEQSGIITLSTGAMHCSADYIARINEISRAGYETPPTEGLYIFVEVSDTGCGMDEATCSRLFDPFFTTKFTGRGLGMAAVLGIVRGHKGVITVQSEVGKGSVFRVLFPENVKEDSADSRLYGNIIEQKWEGVGTILVVDDEETIRAVARSMLEKLGFKVLTASDGHEAVKIFSEHSSEIKCIILDLTMPHLDGVETFERLRSMQYNVKVILCSGYTEQDATERFIGSDLAGFIQKPYNISMLKETLEKIL